MPSLVTVAANLEVLEAHILRNRLEVEGVPASIAHENHVRMNWFLSSALGGVKIQVPEVFAEQALQVIADSEAGVFALEEIDEIPKCPNCGSENLSIGPASSKKIALLGLVIFSLPLPFRHDKLRCGNCNWTANQPDYPLE